MLASRFASCMMKYSIDPEILKKRFIVSIVEGEHTACERSRYLRYGKKVRLYRTWFRSSPLTPGFLAALKISNFLA